MLFRIIETVSGSVVVRTGPKTDAGPGPHEVSIWEGEAATKEEALRLAAKADARLDIRYIRIRHELDMEQRG